MKDKKLICEYIYLRIQKYEVEKQYYDLLGEGIEKLTGQQELIERFTDKLLGFSTVESDVVDDFVFKCVYGPKNASFITPDTVEEVADWIIKGIEEDE